MNRSRYRKLFRIVADSPGRDHRLELPPTPEMNFQLYYLVERPGQRVRCLVEKKFIEPRQPSPLTENNVFRDIRLARSGATHVTMSPRAITKCFRGVHWLFESL